MQAFGLATSVSSSQFGLSTKLPVSVQVSSWVVAGPADGPGWPACSGCSCVGPELLVLSLDHLELGRAKKGVHVLPIVVQLYDPLKEGAWVEPALGDSSQNLPAPEKTDSTFPAAAILQAVAADLRHVDSKRLSGSECLSSAQKDD